MTRWLLSFLAALRRDPPDRDYLVQLRDLWRVPPDWQHQPTSRVLTKTRLTVVKTDRKAG